MNFWLDRNSESNNVVVLQQNNILVGSCDKQAYDNVFTQLTADVAPIEVLGTEDIQIIPFDKLQNLTSKNTDTSIDLQYLAKKGTEDFTLDFETLEQKNACLQLMTAREFPQLSLTVAKQSALSASISPVLSLLCAIGLGSLYIDRLRWVTIIVCGLWALLSLYGLYKRATNPPVVTKLSLKGRYGRKFVSGVKTAGGYLLA
ncbi:hypothetical protein [Algibacillus agarilyticus]|uniref:hypothetical protein n=1 Tax=Algibacillus agarilyticus TaxID=2234133 RepID=UPI000DCFA28C|nr:hypothetical protein [Algibacillus agarilyticus]